MVAFIFSSSLLIAAFALLLVRVGLARANSRASLAAPPRIRPTPVPVEIRLVPRRLNAVG